MLPDPGVFPEESLLDVAQGAVTAIHRFRGSSVLPAGEHVLEDRQLQEIGGVLWQTAQVFPIEGLVPTGANVLPTRNGRSCPTER